MNGNDKEVYDTTGLISGTSVQVLEVGKWTKFEGTYKIPSGAKKVVIRILEQGDWQEPGSCIMGKYYVANVSMKRSQNQTGDRREHSGLESIRYRKSWNWFDRRYCHHVK